jgi:tRNA 2-selenouridine synthase
MPVSRVHLDVFLSLKEAVPILDVRSPSEYAHAHIPGAYSFPIFNDEERAIVGTAYKQESRENAIKLGLNFFGKNLTSFVEAAEKILSKHNGKQKTVCVHCWRGGMRSAAIAWLLDLYGFKVYLLNGGYKAYRNWVISQFDKPYELTVIGGYTGSNKTAILEEINKSKGVVIDLEKIAGHKGSAFGNLGLDPQPSQEHFENILATELELKYIDNNTVFIEGESQRIGNVNLPLSFYKTMRAQPLIFLDIPFEQRLMCIVEGYGRFEKEQILNGISRITKRLGGLETKNAIDFLMAGNIKECFAILLKYYDKFYHRSTFTTEDENRKTTFIKSDTTDPSFNLHQIYLSCFQTVKP